MLDKDIKRAIKVLRREGHSFAYIAEEMGLSWHTVRNFLIKVGEHDIKHRIDVKGKIQCTRCKKHKYAKYFPKIAESKFTCSKCLRTYNHAIQLNRNGFNIKIYKKLFKDQEGKCAICGANVGHYSKTGKSCKLALDHDHESGRVRGLLCGKCNRGLGLFEDSLANLRNAVKYLKQHNR